MKTIAIILSCAFIAPFAFAQTGITREPTTITTTQTVAALDSTHVMAVNAFAPGDKIVVQTAPATQPVTVRLDKGVSYVNEHGRLISPRSIQPGSHVRLEFVGDDANRVVTRVILVNPH
jgi:hypothetical protein